MRAPGGSHAAGRPWHVARVATTATAAKDPAVPRHLMALAVDGAHDRLYAGGQDGAWMIDNVSTRAAGTAPAAGGPAVGAAISAFAFAGQ